MEGRMLPEKIIFNTLELNIEIDKILITKQIRMGY